jgi:DNA polymerase III delta prime subunit
MSTEIWSFKYEPGNLSQMILAPDVRVKLEKAITDLPNIMLFGNPGTGKGTFKNIFLKQTGCDFLPVNASDETGIDHIRGTVRTFAHGGSSSIKYVILNESEALSSGKSGAQKMLKELMEVVQKKTRFFYMTNEVHNMNSALRSRCMEICLDYPPKKDLGLHLAKILKNEGVKFTPKILTDIIKKCYPDIRKCIWSIQENTINGKLTGSNIYAAEALYKEILLMVKTKDLDQVRTLLKSNYVNYKHLYEYLFEQAMSTEAFKMPGDEIIQIGDHLRYNETTCNAEINFMHMVFYMLWKEII